MFHLKTELKTSPNTRKKLEMPTVKTCDRYRGMERIRHTTTYLLRKHRKAHARNRKNTGGMVFIPNPNPKTVTSIETLFS